MLTRHQVEEVVRRVLRGSALPSSIQYQIAEYAYANDGVGQKQMAKGLQAFLGEGDFSWPWFDEWNAAFKQAKKWPDHPPAWSWFEAQATMTAKQAGAKRMLLVASIAHSAFMLFRFEQVCDVINTTRMRKVALNTTLSDPVAIELSRNWVFDSSNNSNLPPFFPGDCTGIEVQR